MSNNTFEIGLVGAGAISAGAYSAGVIDFLVEALDTWYAAKEKGEIVPSHDVKLSVFSGASAGAITATLATGYLASNQPPVTNEREGRANNGRNKLFDSWVDKIDISNLLESQDLKKEESTVISLLDSTILQEIADKGLDIKPRAQKRPYLADDFQLVVTVTNLRGVPYSFEVLGDKPSRYDMSLHADYLHFCFNDTGKNDKTDRYTLKWSDLSGVSPMKEKIKTAALASGAFPIGLAPRELSHIISDTSRQDMYNSRKWPVPTPFSEAPHQCTTMKSIPPDWGKIGTNYTYNFKCVDGGVMNNEPLELARQLLAGANYRNKRGEDSADRAVLLIDPFPSHSQFSTDEKEAKQAGLFELGMNLFTALKNQARFKPDELLLACSDKVFSRFMIAPSRNGETFPIACGSLGGFGGFLKRDFRAHDYFLGRRNAQKFLKDYFVLSEINPLFSEWKNNQQMIEEFCVKDRTGTPKLKDGKRLLPIIPLLGELHHIPCFEPLWPQYSSRDLSRLMKKIEGRLETVFDRLVNEYFAKPKHNILSRYIAKFTLNLKKDDILNIIEKEIEKDLKKMLLLK